MTDTPSSPAGRAVDADWIRDVVAEFETALLRHSVRLLNGDADRARDVVQDTFLKLWQTDRTSVESHLAQWLFTVSRNRALDVLRKERRMTTLNGPPDTMPLRLANTGTPDGELCAQEGRRQAIDLLEALPEKESEAIRLKLQAKLSYREIAEVMGLTVSHVGVLIHTGLKSIRATLEAPSLQPSNVATGGGGH